jgi:hypothetical protein
LNGLILEYGEERFLKWCQNLKILRFCKSHPYPDDLKPDRFIALTKFGSRKELEYIVNLIHLSFKEDDINSYLKKSTKKVISGNALINGINCYANINEVVGYLEIEVMGIEGDPFNLTDDTFERAKSLDDYLIAAKLEFETSPHDDDYCITPEFYPDVWK